MIVRRTYKPQIMKTLVLSILVFTVAYISNAQDYAGSFEFDGYEREYEVYLPQDFQANMPLIVSLHGIPETVEWYKTYILMHEVADTLGYVIVYPHGIGKSWNVGVIEPGEYFPDTDDVGFISALIDTMKTKWDIDLSRVYCCGYSGGGMLSFRMAGELGHRLAAIASVSGSLFGLADTWHPIQPMPVLNMNGTNDNLVPYEGEGDFWSAQNTINYWLENNQCTAQVDTFSFPDIVPGDSCTIQKISYTGCSGESEVIHYKGINMGHSWPGTTSLITFGGEGNRNMDINANVEILNFFKQFENPLVNMAYSKSLEVYPFNIQSPGDTITVRAKVHNPENHNVDVYAFIHGEQFTFEDSIRLYDDGLHEDGDSSDNIWGNMKLFAGLSENAFKVDLLTQDIDLGTDQYYHLPARFINLGPVEFDEYIISPDFLCNSTIPAPGGCLNLKISLKNNSSLATAKNLTAELTSLDSLAWFINSSFNFEDIAAGETSESESGIHQFWISKECPLGTELPIEVAISSFDHICWRDTFSIIVPIIDEVQEIPEPLFRMFPNPAHDLLTIQTDNTTEYSIEISSLNAQLLFRIEAKGSVQHLDLSPFQKGVYFITIRSKDFVATRKIIKL